MNKNWPLHFFPRFCCACLEVDKQAHHHPRSKRIKHALTLFMLLCLTGRWFDVNELNQMIPYQLFPLLFYILRKVGAYIFLFKNELLLFFSLHPSIFRTNPWVWMRPEVFCSIQNCCNWGACWECIVWLSLFGISHFVHIICLVGSRTYVFLSIFHPKIYNTQQW